MSEYSKLRQQWAETTLAPHEAKETPRTRVNNLAGHADAAALYGPDDEEVSGFDPARDLGVPGRPPFTRGVQPNMYRGRLWTMRQYAGFGTAKESNERYRYLLEQGQTGLSVAFDLPTQMGRDSDDPRARGEVGRVGVAIDSIEDMRVLLGELPLDKISTSMTINSTAAILLCLYVAVAEERGVARKALRGTMQNDILKEYIARGTYIYPPRPSLRLITDMFAWCAREVPKWNTISISGYHIREAGSDAAQELAFTLADGDRLREGGGRRGARRRLVRSPALVLLQRAQQPHRGGRQVPRRAPHVERDHEGPLRREDRPGAGAALPLPDGGDDAHGAAAARQRRARHRADARGRARRLPVAPHELVRRGARPSDERGRDDRAPHPAGRRPRERRRGLRRCARGQLRSRGADDAPREARVRLPRRASTRWAGWWPRSSRGTRSARSSEPPTTTSSRSSARSASSWE